jgi:hypothetical protein
VFNKYFHFCKQALWEKLRYNLLACFNAGRAAYNKRFHAIAAGRWSNEPRLVIHLLFGREVIY